jgi:hypothetical protein
MLHQIESRSEVELETYCERYIPSTRDAFDSSPFLKYENFLNRKIAGLSVQQIIRMLNKMPSAEVSEDQDLAHHIFVIRPGRTRSTPLIEVATQYLLTKVIEGLGTKLKVAAQELFDVYRRNDITLAAAGQLLEPVVSGQFAKGGCWTIHQTEKSTVQGSENVHWKIRSSSTYKDKHLTVGLPGNPFSISDTPPAENATFDPIGINLFPSAGPFDLVTSYYLPISKTEATFDSFYYNANLKQATVLQFTVSKRQSMKVKGLKRLEDLGVKSVCYVAVTGPQKEFDLPVPNEYSEFVKEKYHLALGRLN